MDTFLHDLRYAVRQLVRTPMFALTVIITLGLGIGANTALFTLSDSILVRTRPGVREPKQLYWIGEANPREGDRHPRSVAYPAYRAYAAGTRGVLTGIAAHTDEEVAVSGDHEAPERVRAQVVSGNYFSLLGTPMAKGRGFLPAEDSTIGTHPVIVLGYDFWQRRFGGDPAILGRSVNINGIAHTVVGVTPELFNGADHELPRALYVPMAMLPRIAPANRADLADAHSRWVTMIARSNGADQPHIDAALASVSAELQRADSTAAEHRVALSSSASNGMPMGAGEDIAAVAALAGTVTLLVLLIACANVSNLLLGRAMKRRREIAIRLSLGASRGRVVRQLLTESVLLGIIASAVGLLFALWGTDWLYTSGVLPLRLELSPNFRVIAFSVGAALLTGVVFGLVPALDSTRADVQESLKDGGASGPGRRRTRLQGRFVIAQVALSLVLLATAGLFLRSLSRQAAADLGFAASSNVLALSVDLDAERYTTARAQQFAHEMLDRARGLPGVQSATLTNHVPLSQRHVGVEVRSWDDVKKDRLANSERDNRSVFLAGVGPGYFNTLGLPVTAGRAIAETDVSGSPKVAVVSQALAEALWPKRSPIGERLSMDSKEGPWLTVVGVAQEAFLTNVNERRRPVLYIPLAQDTASRRVSILIRTTGDATRLAPTMRREIAALDPDVPVFDVRTLEAYRRESLSEYRNSARIIALFGLLALALAAMGVYAVMAFAVAQRTREIGVRIALGAHAHDVVRLFVRQALRLTTTGAAIGVVLGLLVTRLMQGMLYGLETTDAVTFAAVALLLVAVGAAASWAPARRASRVDPMVALRQE
ncbi:MAG: permease [Gemmatimonadetes bacterium]|nr:permease [Gemmatimonadota bacterium]